MNKYKFAFLLLGLTMTFMVLPIALMASKARASDAGTCYTVGDADARTYCIARARGDAGMCYAVQRSDLRAQCLAEVRK